MLIRVQQEDGDVKSENNFIRKFNRTRVEESRCLKRSVQMITDRQSIKNTRSARHSRMQIKH